MLPKVPKWDIFGPKFNNFYFCAKPWNLKNWRVLILNIAILFSNSRLNVPNKKYFGRKLIFFGFTWKSAYFKYDNNFYKILPKYTKMRYI